MKSLSILVIGLLMSIFTIAKSMDDGIPALAKKSFKTKFPNVTDVKWGKESDNEFEAEFKLNGKEMSANFSGNGEWMQTETVVTLNELPSKVQKAFKAKYAKAAISETSIIELPKSKLYEVEYKEGKKTIELKYKEDGSEITREENTEEK